MARCDEGYLCEVCHGEVAEITDSDLYLRYVMGLVPFDELQRSPERHIRCNPVQAQFIVHPEFNPVEVEGLFDKRSLDPADVRRQEEFTTRAWLRLQELAGSGLPVEDYPLAAEGT